MQKQIIEVCVTGYGLAALVAQGQITQKDADQIEADARAELSRAIAALSHNAMHAFVVCNGASVNNL